MEALLGQKAAVLLQLQMMSISRDEKNSLWFVLCPDMPESLWNDSHAGKRERERERKRERESNESNDAEFSAVVVNAFNM